MKISGIFRNKCNTHNMSVIEAKKVRINLQSTLLKDLIDNAD